MIRRTPIARPWTVLLAALWTVLALTAAGPGAAHTSGTTGYAAVTVDGQAVRYSLSLPVEVLASIAPPSEPDGRLAAAVAEHVRIAADGRACEPVPERTVPPAPDRATVQVVILYACGAPVSELGIRDDMSALLGAGHHTLTTVEWPGGRTQLVFEADRRDGRVVLAPAGGHAARSDAAGDNAAAPQAGSAAGVFSSYLVLGVEHIVLGFDHVLFVLALILQGGRLLSIVAIVTAFTVAHSVTLALSVLDVMSLPPAIVEPVIALSIAYVAAENVFLGERAVTRRWWVSLIFGLVHGFGFAGALREVGLPSADLAVALLSFNLGVEAGQAAIVLLLVPPLIWVRRYAWEGRAVRLASTAIMTCGLALLVERTVAGGL